MYGLQDAPHVAKFDGFLAIHNRQCVGGVLNGPEHVVDSIITTGRGGKQGEQMV